jgi:hypothetical protein
MLWYISSHELSFVYGDSGETTPFDYSYSKNPWTRVNHGMFHDPGNGEQKRFYCEGLRFGHGE